MLEARVSRTRIDQVRHSELLYSTEALKGGRVYDCPFLLLEIYETMDRIPDLDGSH